MGEVLGLAGGLVMTVSAVYYLADVLRGRSRPQRSSWAVWAVTGLVGFGTADAGGAGPGAYAAAVDSVACAATFLLSLHPRFGKPGGRRTDLLLVAVALAGVVLWRWGPLTLSTAALLAVGCELAALWPTLREAWQQPQLESLASWSADVLGSGLCLAVVGRPTVAALAYPAYLVGASLAVAVVLLLRRGSAHAGVPVLPAPPDRQPRTVTGRPAPVAGDAPARPSPRPV
jgi:hypothetical protein